MAHFVTIAGPQSSGKSTTMDYLKTRHPSWVFIDEINPRTITKNSLMGAAQTSSDLERQVLEEDIKKIRKTGLKNNTFVECGIFHYTYALHFLDRKEANLYFDKYLKLYSERSPLVIFIDTKPEISWRRRKGKYIDRIRKSGETNKIKIKKKMDEYKKTIFDLYPSWHKCYKKIPFRKITIKNSYKTEREFLREVEKLITSLLSRRLSQ